MRKRDLHRRLAPAVLGAYLLATLGEWRHAGLEADLWVAVTGVRTTDPIVVDVDLHLGRGGFLLIVAESAAST